jgi:hypothetical protein
MDQSRFDRVKVMTGPAFRKLALSLPEAREEPHFRRASFRVGKKIFATMEPDGSEAMVRVRPLERVQDLLSARPEVFLDYGGWTWRNGALGIRLRKADAKLIRELVLDAWRRIAPKRALASGPPE